MFTQRYIKLPGQLYSIEDVELLDKSQDEARSLDVEIRVNPFRIDSYLPSFSTSDMDEPDCTKICMQSGDTYLIFMHIDKFERLMDSTG